jgi:septal ring factor EnvC (AmiA/AmiB activator)
MRGFIVCLLVLTLPCFCIAQSQQELQKKKDALLKEISQLQKELDATTKNKKTTLQQLKAIQNKIKARENLIQTFNEQVHLIDQDITTTSTSISNLRVELEKMRANYTKMVRYAYKHRTAYDILIFIFSAQSFNDALARIKYTRRYNTYKKFQARLITISVNDLNEKKKVLVTQKDEKQILIEEQQKEKKALSVEQQQQDKAVKTLSKQEKKIKDNIANKKKEQQKLNKQIQDLIKKEIAAVSKPSGTKPTSGSTSTMTLTPEAKALSSSFASNMGKLPWPVEVGTIWETFGTHEHPVLKNVTTKNNGLDIKTSKGANVRSVFNGSVVSVLTNPVYHRAVLIRHGEYFTVYSNLESVNVKSGDKVTTKQIIGKAFTDKENDLTTVHIEIWKGTLFQNPQLWLMKK